MSGWLRSQDDAGFPAQAGSGFIAMEKQRNPHMSHWDGISDWLDKWLFFSAFLLGVAGIIALKVFHANLPALLWAGFVMISYALYVMTAKHYVHRADRAGDNLYYLGFLFTLTSLAHSLYLFSSGEDTARGILANFGLALATTIMGLALRIMFNQMREDPAEIEREARSDLAEAVSKLKVELHNTVMEFNSFRRAMVQSLSEGMNDLAGASQAALEESTLRFSSIVDKTADDMEKTMTAFQENAEKLNSLSWAAAVATDDLFRKIRGMNVSNGVLENKFEQAMENTLAQYSSLLKELSENARENVEAARSIRKMMKENPPASAPPGENSHDE